MPTTEHLILRGLVLREVDYRDADRMLTILTAEQGLVSAVARGARRKGSHFGAGTQLFVYSEFTFFEYRGKLSVDAAEPQELFMGLRNDILRLALASYMAEALAACAPERSPASALLGDALNLLYALSRGLKSEAVIKAAFELRASAICGWQPDMAECGVCGAETPEDPVVEIASGELKCARHAVGDRAELDAASLAAARFLLRAPSRRMLSFELPEGSLALLGGMTERYFLDKMERGFGTLDFYKSLL